VYQLDRDEFDVQDKYVGRTLTPESFQSTLYHFLHNGSKLLADCIPYLIEQLIQMSAEIKKMPGYRFYGSSLLIVYDGLAPAASIKMMLIDFTHCITRSELEQNQHDMSYPPEHGAQCPDDGFLKGLHTLIDILKKMSSE
jgi:hypothetical protein